MSQCVYKGCVCWKDWGGMKKIRYDEKKEEDEVVYIKFMSSRYEIWNVNSERRKN